MEGDTFRGHIFPVVLLAWRPPLRRVASPAPALTRQRREVAHVPDAPSARSRLWRGTGRLSGSSRECIRCYICLVSTGCKRLCHGCRTHEACWRTASPPLERTNRACPESQKKATKCAPVNCDSRGRTPLILARPAGCVDIS